MLKFTKKESITGMWAEYALQSSIFMHSRNATYLRNTMINCNYNWHLTYFSSLSKYFVPLKTSYLVCLNFFSNIRFTYFQCYCSSFCRRFWGIFVLGGNNGTHPNIFIKMHTVELKIRIITRILFDLRTKKTRDFRP